MIEVRQCPICDWKHEAEPPKVPNEALASVFGAGVMAAVAMQQHAHDVERALDAHFRTHSTVEWVKASAALRWRNDQLRRVLHGIVSNRFTEDAAEVEAAYEAAHLALRTGPRQGASHTAVPEPDIILCRACDRGYTGDACPYCLTPRPV